MTQVTEKRKTDGYDDVLAEAGTHGVEFRRLKDLTEPVCIDMLNYWKDVRGTRAMPRPDEMDPIRFARYMPNLLMVQVNWEPFDVTYRLLGEDVVNAHGANFRGRRIIDSQSHTGQFSNVLFNFYKFVAEERRPYAAAGTMEYVARGLVRFEAVYLPLSIGGERTDRILGASISYPMPKY
jgi:hypothetical protein